MPNVDRQLSTNALPLPVVLVVGDAHSYFSIEAWKGVVAAYAEATSVTHDEDAGKIARIGKANRDAKTAENGQASKGAAVVRQVPITWSDLAPVLDATHEDSPRLLSTRGWGPKRRTATRRPLPLQLTHDHEMDSGRLQDQIRRALDLFDVWGIIASASAGQVEPVRKALQGIDIPLLVTTDSTTVPAGEQPANELRLMPSNRAQARAMLSTAVMAEKVDRPHRDGIDPEVLMGPPRIAYSWDVATQAREYVRDLRGELEAEASRLNLHPLDPYDDHHDYDGPLVVIGYTPHAEELLAKREPGRLTILSDGCATKRVYDAVERQFAAQAGYWFITRPHLTHQNLGRQAYSAIVEAGSELLTSQTRRGRTAAQSNTSCRDRIKRILHATDETHFEFNGIENVAIAYRVVPVVNEKDLRTATPPDERAGEHVLAAVDGRAYRVTAS